MQTRLEALLRCRRWLTVAMLGHCAAVLALVALNVLGVRLPLAVVLVVGAVVGFGLIGCWWLLICVEFDIGSVRSEEGARTECANEDE